MPAQIAACQAVSEDLSRIALSLESEVLLLDGSGRTLAKYQHPSWERWSAGACTFDRDGDHVWALIPVDNRSAFVVLALDDLKEVDRAQIDSVPAGLQPLHHPDGRSIGWSIGEGQDGALIVWTLLGEGQIQMRKPATYDRVLVALHPSGYEYLTTPHGSGQIHLHRFSDDAVIASVAPPENANWEFVAGYLDPERIIAVLNAEDEEEEEDRLVLLERDPLRIVDKIVMKASPNHWRSLAWVGRGSWMTVGDVSAEMWSLGEGEPATTGH